MTGLFFLRLGLYFLTVLLPLFHPAVVLYLETSGILFYLILIPAECLAARIKPVKKAAGMGMLLLCIPFLTDGFTGMAFVRSALGLLVWCSTRLVFFKGALKLLYPEPFLMSLFFFRILRLSHASEEVSRMSRNFDLPVIGGFVLLFLLYTFAVYRAEYQLPESKSRRKPLFLILTAVLLLILPVFFFPRSYVNFIKTLGTPNNLFQPRYRRVDNRGVPDEGNGDILDSRMGEPDLPGGTAEEGDSPELLMGSGNWNNPDNRRGRQETQYLVMIVRSEEEQVYLADRYFSMFDREDGLTPDPDYPLNALMGYQFLETWENQDSDYGTYRVPVGVDVFSTIPDRVSPYVPLKLEPTVQNQRYDPLAYSYRALSLISRISLGSPPPVLRDLREEDLPELWPFLEVNLDDSDSEAYDSLLSEILDRGDSSGVRIEKILKSFEDFQYNIGFTDDISIRAINRFLFDSRSGDCTEFSNAAAILGRLAGIPSRVVTGYLMSGALQTRAHRQGVAEIREHYPPLQDLPEEELYMVTTSHRHSWVQFYFPLYGWVDYEATAYAIPPLPQGNPNNYDVVIPDISSWENPKPVVTIPWLLLFRMVLASGGAALLFLYLKRWYRLAVLIVLSRKRTEKGLKSLYHLLLIRLKARGYSLKSPDLTPEEYAFSYPEFGEFARGYTRALYSVDKDQVLKSSMTTLREEYRRLTRAKATPLILLKEVFTLKDYPFL